MASSQETAAPQLAGRVKNRICGSLWAASPSHTRILEPGLPGLRGNTFPSLCSAWFARFCCSKPQEANARREARLSPRGQMPQGGQRLKNSSFSQFWRLGVQDRVPASLLFGESWLSISQMVPLHCVLTRKGLGSSLGFFYKGTNSIHAGPISNPNLLPKAPPPKTITLGVWFHHTNLGAGTNHSKVGSELCSQLKY